MTAETLIAHGGDLVSWHVASGYCDKPLQRVAPEKLRIDFGNVPKVLRVYYKRDGVLLWHPNAAGASKILARAVTQDDLQALPTATYAIVGRVSDPSGHFLPRTFAFTLGGTAEHAIALYHSPLGARFDHGGGIYGRIVFENQTPAAWALLTVTVTPPLGPVLAFTAQADAYGEFRLPLNRLPALTKDAPASSYGAKLEVRAAASADVPLDPETLTAAQVADGKDGDGVSQFASFFTFAVTPGRIAEVASPEHDRIVLESM